MGLLERIAAARTERRYSADAYLTDYLIPSMSQWGYGDAYNGLRTSWGLNNKVEEYSATLPGHSAAVRACPPAFAAEMVRALVLSQVRFTFRNLPSSRTPRRLFGNTSLSVLETPWPGATTGELVTRMEWHAGLAGNSFVTSYWPGRLRVLRPDWVSIVFGSQREPEDAAYALDGELLGYAYINGGISALGRNELTMLLPDEVCHWAPLPDPEGANIGMSWISAAMRDILGDRAATEHKNKFFANGATPNLVIKGIKAPTKAQFDEIVEGLDRRHNGVANAYRSLYLTEGADATVIGSDLKQLDFKATQGAGETRIAMLGRVPAPLLGISEGLSGSSLNSGNFGMARRIFADSWIYPTLQDLAGSLASLVKVPSDAELWFDTADMPILREDARDAAEIEDIKASTISKHITSGFDPDSAVAAVLGQNIALLKHSGLVSVQLQPPGTEPQAVTAGGAAPKALAAKPATARHRAIDQRKFDPDQPRDPHDGKWIDTTPGSALKDALKLAGKIDLDDGETLVGSGKFDFDSNGGIRWALTDLNGQPRLRLGLGGDGFGQRDYDEGLPAWNGNNDMDRLNAERAALRDEQDRLESEWEGASPERRKEIEKRLDELEEMDLNEIYSTGATAILDPAGMGRLDEIDAASEAADLVAKADEAYWNRVEAEADRLEAERNKLIAQLDTMDAMLPSPWTDEQKAEYQRKLKRVKELHGAADDLRKAAQKDAPVTDYTVFGEGVIPGTDWGDIHYEVYIDDPSLGARVNVGVKPRDAESDWELSSENSGTFDTPEWRKFMRQIAEMRAAFQKQ